ncbi:hypothetical protein P9J83_13535 [Clostridium sporogenes]|uniref:Uncharacterized protein n=1 Tax=Clostridium sporogenes TaxID=1509 RepID=A0AAE4FLI5_CLOSG|nr:hypothetical protein [Clostridium sporogenes]MDS1004514.1 hypothetical protein [Clostridium sporogenes]
MPINNVTLEANTVIIDVAGNYLVEFIVFMGAGMNANLHLIRLEN